MTPAEFKAWRKALDLKQKEAAEKLGLKKRMIQYYETGNRGGKKVVIPKTVELACGRRGGLRRRYNPKERFNLIADSENGTAPLSSEIATAGLRTTAFPSSAFRL